MNHSAAAAAAADDDDDDDSNIFNIFEFCLTSQLCGVTSG